MLKATGSVQLGLVAREEMFLSKIISILSSPFIIDSSISWNISQNMEFKKLKLLQSMNLDNLKN